MSESFPKTIGRYELIDRLAVGGMAELFLARSMTANAPTTPVVIKQLLPHIAGDPHFNAMFIDEARLTSRLTHPNIVGAYELGRQDDRLYMVMEFVDGIDCLAVLRECAQRHMRVPHEISVYIMREILDALHFAHTQNDDRGRPLHIVHRDISPSNVLLSRTGDVKLLDFGIARAASREHKTKDGTLKGKYGYMSPEQVLEENVDARSDLFSVGILLAEMLTGRRLFAARNELDVLLMVRDVRLTRLEKYGEHIPGDLREILHRALAKRPDNRYPSAAVFRDVLTEWKRHNAPQVSRTSIAEIVRSLYDSVRARDSGRDTPAVDSWPQRRASASLRTGIDSMPDIELIDGIPAGHHNAVDNSPLVSIEMIEDVPAATPEPHGTHPMGTGGIVMPIDGIDESSGIEFSEAFAIHESPDASRPDASGPRTSVMDDDYPPNAQAIPVPIGTRAQLSSRIRVVADATDFDDEPVSMVEHWGSQRPDASTARIVSGRTTPPARQTPDDQGQFSESPPIAVFYRLAITRASGLLRAECGSIRKDVYFREGIPEFVSSNLASERFGAYLVQNGELSDEELSMALAMMPHYSGRLGDTLVALGLLKPLDVFRLLTTQVRQRLIELCTWSKGTFSWYGGRENPDDAFPLDLNAFEIIGAGAIALPEPVVKAWLITLSLECQPRCSHNARIGIEVFQLGEFLTEVFTSLHGEFHLSELEAYYRERREHDRFVRMLYLLFHTELVELAD